MIDSQEDYKKFIEDNWSDDLFLHIVLADDREHPYTLTPSIIFIQNCRTEVLYHLSIDHQDAPKVVGLDEFVSDIGKFSGRLFVLDKKSIIHHIPLGKKLVDINLGFHLKSEKLINYLECETTAHRFIRQKYYTYPLLNKVVPLMKHREVVCNIFTKVIKLINLPIFRDKSFLRINNEVIETLADIERNGVYVDVDKFKKHFDATVHNGYVYSQYNLHTATGRPSNRFGGVNYAALNKEDGSRECFVSRFGEDGTMVMVDYSAFHPRIICELTDFKLGYAVDFYSYIAKLCFKKDDVDEQDVSEAKGLTFRQLYGGVEDEYSHIQFFYNLNGFIESHWKEFIENGYTTTPIFGRKITDKQIQDPNPCKLFNYILQATETEIAVPILGKVNEFLRDKKSKSVLFIYDSILFDVHNSELSVIKKDVVSIMRDNQRFPIKCYIGKSYAQLKQISL